MLLGMDDVAPDQNYERRKSVVGILKKKISGPSAASQVEAAPVKEDAAPTCAICYDELTDEITFEFKACKHRFCTECCQSQLKQHIERGAIEKMICFQYKCGKQVSMEELDQLFKDE